MIVPAAQVRKHLRRAKETASTVRYNLKRTHAILEFDGAAPGSAGRAHDRSAMIAKLTAEDAAWNGNPRE